MKKLLDKIRIFIVGAAYHGLDSSSLLQAFQSSGILTIKLGPTDIISKMIVFLGGRGERQVPINMLLV